MSGIEQRVMFADPLGNAFPPVVGTGFFRETHDGHNILVTNRHILDPRSKLGSDTAYRLARVEVELRAVVSTSRPIVDAAEMAAPQTRFFELDHGRRFVHRISGERWPARNELGRSGASRLRCSAISRVVPGSA
jgi:hypothetical protein